MSRTTVILSGLLLVVASACDRSATLAPRDADSYRAYTAEAAFQPHGLPNFTAVPGANVVVNGSFEQNGGENSSNSFPGWSEFSTAIPQRGAWAAQAGTILLGTSVVPAPTDGQFAAFSWNVVPALQALYQDVTVPAAGGTLSFDLAIENRDGDFFTPPLTTPPPTPNQQVRVDLIDPSQSPAIAGPAGVLLILYQSHGGDPLTGPYHHIAADVSAFAGQTVRLRFFIAHDRGNLEVGVDNVVLVAKDVTPPVVTYSGALASYTVDQNVNITCSATDADSGVASTTCANITGPAYDFAIGANTFSATATDNAGNTGSGSVTFTVSLTCPAVTNVVRQLVTDAKAQKKLADRMDNVCDKVAKNSPAKDEQVKNFLKELAGAQADGAVTAPNAAVLSRLVQLL